MGATGEAALAVWPAAVRAGRYRRNLRAFMTTVTLEIAIAAAAHIGSSTPNTASGIITTLYEKAQNRFCPMTR